jgi:Uncharacterized conserved protein
MVEAMTDNRNRTAAEMRHLFSKYSGNLGESGCVSWMFKKKGVFVVDKETGVNEEELMMIVLDAGAEDLQSEEGQFEISVAPEDFENVQKALEMNNIQTLVSQIAMVPDTTIAVTGDDAVKLSKLVEFLEDHDDVQEVYGNFELPDDMEDE